MAIKVFISHCAADAALAGALAECLLGAMTLKPEQVRCTSVAQLRLPQGRDFCAMLREDMDADSVVIGLVTKNTLAASWVLFELGATWGAGKKLVPIVTEEVDPKPLPAPLSGNDIARISTIREIAQFIDEVTFMTASATRPVAEIAEAIDKLLAAHGNHVNAATQASFRPKPVPKGKEAVFSGMPFSELAAILRNELVVVPASVNPDKVPRTTPLLDLFVSNAKNLADGVRSDYERNSAGAFLYQECGLRLLPYNLVQFDKLSAADAKWFKRLSMTADGHKFLVEYKRLGMPGR